MYRCKALWATALCTLAAPHAVQAAEDPVGDYIKLGRVLEDDVEQPIKRISLTKSFGRLESDQGTDEYWVKSDYTHRDAASDEFRAQVFGYHKRNIYVSYRMSSRVFSIDCKRLRWRVEKTVFYSAQGEIVGVVGQEGWRRILVGGMSGELMYMGCF